MKEKVGASHINMHPKLDPLERSHAYSTLNHAELRDRSSQSTLQKVDEKKKTEIKKTHFQLG